MIYKPEDTIKNFVSNYQEIFDRTISGINQAIEDNSKRGLLKSKYMITIDYTPEMDELFNAIFQRVCTFFSDERYDIEFEVKPSEDKKSCTYVFNIDWFDLITYWR